MTFEFIQNEQEYLAFHEGTLLGVLRYYETAKFPQRGAALSFEIPSRDFTKGAEALKLFLQSFVFKEFAFCITDPNADQKELIQMYESAGFAHYAKIEDFLILKAIPNL